MSLKKSIISFQYQQGNDSQKLSTTTNFGRHSNQVTFIKSSTVTNSSNIDEIHNNPDLIELKKKMTLSQSKQANSKYYKSRKKFKVDTKGT